MGHDAMGVAAAVVAEENGAVEGTVKALHHAVFLKRAVAGDKGDALIEP